MFVIRRAQLAAFESSARTDIEERILRLLREHFSEAPALTSDQGALALVRAAVNKAASYGMRAERDAFKFAVLMLAFGPDFDTTVAWACRILHERSGDAPVADLLYREAIARTREREPAPR